MEKPIKFTYERERFKIDISKEGSVFKIKCSEPVLMNLGSVQNELSSKKVKVYDLSKSLIMEDVEFKGLMALRYSNKDAAFTEVINPENILKFTIAQEELTVKSIKGFREEIHGSFINQFKHRANYENHDEFIKFFSIAMKEEYKVVEDESFAGEMLKFYKGDKLVKCIYIKDEKIEFVESFAEKYKELQLGLIKEAIDNINEKLQIEGKQKISLEKLEKK